MIRKREKRLLNLRWSSSPLAPLAAGARVASEWRSVGQSQHPKTRDQSQIISSRRQERREDGLEVKVAFGDVWKQSLTELSGGQRSLVALSLILALLLYNPAPIYILDQVDAALDQNHTTNIGFMIKKHFSKSQFIIVSLKEDMFNNANVLFKTKFVDGHSTVTRYETSRK